VPQPASRAQAIAASLTAAGYEPRIRRRSGQIRVEVEPGSPSLTAWRVLLAALERADRFGLNNDASGATAWALIYTTASGRAGRKPGQQP
jgi:hypothetical protein